MRHSNQGRFREQLSFLRRQFLQDQDLPLMDVLSETIFVEALLSIEFCWKDRIYPPLVTLRVFLSQVLSADHSCRAAAGAQAGTLVGFLPIGEQRAAHLQLVQCLRVAR